MDTDVYRHINPRTHGHLHVLEIGPVTVNLDGKQARVNGKPIAMPLQEFELLAALMANAGRAMTYRELSEKVWALRHTLRCDRTLKVNLNRLRNRLTAANPDAAALLRQVVGLGYVFDLEP